MSLFNELKACKRHCLGQTSQWTRDKREEIKGMVIITLKDEEVLWWQKMGVGAGVRALLL